MRRGIVGAGHGRRTQPPGLLFSARLGMATSPKRVWLAAFACIRRRFSLLAARRPVDNALGCAVDRAPLGVAVVLKTL
jgi:hypothetical protein